MRHGFRRPFSASLDNAHMEDGGKSSGRFSNIAYAVPINESIREAKSKMRDSYMHRKSRSLCDTGSLSYSRYNGRTLGSKERFYNMNLLSSVWPPVHHPPGKLEDMCAEETATWVKMLASLKCWKEADKYADTFRTHSISGYMLSSFTSFILKEELGIEKFGHRLEILSAIEDSELTIVNPTTVVLKSKSRSRKLQMSKAALKKEVGKWLKPRSRSFSEISRSRSKAEHSPTTNKLFNPNIYSLSIFEEKAERKKVPFEAFRESGGEAKSSWCGLDSRIPCGAGIKSPFGSIMVVGSGTKEMARKSSQLSMEQLSSIFPPLPTAKAKQTDFLWMEGWNQLALHSRGIFN